MSARTLDEVRGFLKQHSVHRVRLAFWDLQGGLKSVYVGLDVFPHLVQHDVDLHAIMRSGIPADARGRVDLDSMRRIPWEPSAASFLMDVVTDEGAPHPLCARGLLRRMVESARERSLKPIVTTKIGLILFREAPDAARARAYRGLTPITSGGVEGAYAGGALPQAFLHPLLDQLRQSDVAVESLHAGDVPGSFVVSLAPVPAVDAADQVVVFKNALRELSLLQGLSVTFMARPFEGARNPAAFTTSLYNLEQTENLCVGENSGPSGLAQQFLAGQIEHVPTFMPLLAPTTNSYGWTSEELDEPAFTMAMPRRGQAIAPWHGISVLVGASDVNPYAAIAGILGMGLQGVERNLELPGAVMRDLLLPKRHLDLPATLDEAIGRLRLSNVARSLFGAHVLDHLVQSRRAELEAARRAITDWELRRYFETT